MRRLNPHFLRALLYLGGALLLVLAIVAAGWRLTRQRNSHAIERTVQQHQVRRATDARAQVPADCTANVLRGRLAEASRSLTISAHQYDSLRRLFPATVPELSAQPARYRPE